jgi:hypothetical protein
MGSLLEEDNALQLLLIIDYIFDWARDIYRPSILRQLKAIVSGKTYDEVSVTRDSDIFSWIPHPSAPPHEPPHDPPHDSRQAPFQAPPQASPRAPPQASSQAPPPAPPSALRQTSPQAPPQTHSRTLSGTLDSLMELVASRPTARFAENRIMTLRITQARVKTLMQFAYNRSQTGSQTRINKQTIARDIISLMPSWSRTMIVSRRSLQLLEAFWAGREIITDPSPEGPTIFLALEFAIFVDSKNQVIKQLSCLAISTSAYQSLLGHANFTPLEKEGKDPEQLGLDGFGRHLSWSVLKECLECLDSGSRSELRSAAASRITFSVYSPKIRQANTGLVPAVEALGFAYITQSPIASFAGRIRDSSVTELAAHGKILFTQSMMKEVFVRGCHSVIACNRCKLMRETGPYNANIVPWTGPLHTFSM